MGWAAAVLCCSLTLGLGCGPIESRDELQTLAADMPQEPTDETPSPPSAGGSAAGDESLDAFPLVGSVFPGLGGRLHSSLCDPASDPYSTCI